MQWALPPVVRTLLHSPQPSLRRSKSLSQAVVSNACKRIFLNAQTLFLRLTVCNFAWLCLLICTLPSIEPRIVACLSQAPYQVDCRNCHVFCVSIQTLDRVKKTNTRKCSSFGRPTRRKMHKATMLASVKRWLHFHGKWVKISPFHHYENWTKTLFRPYDAFIVYLSYVAHFQILRVKSWRWRSTHMCFTSPNRNTG